MRKKQVSYVMAAIIITILYFLTEILRLLILISIKMNVRLVICISSCVKILEKYDWDIQTAYKMMEEYDKIKPVSDTERRCLRHCLHFRKILESHELLF